VCASLSLLVLLSEQSFNYGNIRPISKTMSISMWPRKTKRPKIKIRLI
jgi:hypothetical protein